MSERPVLRAALGPDALRSDAALRRQYEALKRELAGRYADHRAAYTEAKGAFIRAVPAA